jgi:hypothetical protein
MPTGRKNPGQETDTAFVSDFGLQLQAGLCKIFQQTSVRPLMAGATSLYIEKENNEQKEKKPEKEKQEVHS